MEYSSFKLQGGDTADVCCDACHGGDVNIAGRVNYAFFFLEYLPFVPLGKELVLTCNHCQHTLENKRLDVKLYKSLKRGLFKLYHILPMYTGLVLMILALCYWQYQAYQKELQTQAYITSPKVNDFYFLNYQGIAENIRPHEKYRLAKVTIVNGNEVSVVYSRYIYAKMSALKIDIKGGMVIDSRYFNRNEHKYTIPQFQAFYRKDIVTEVLRPKSNRLFGNVVVNDVSINKHYKNLADMHNDRGLAFMANSQVEGNIESAREYFSKAARLGLSKGQVNLAKSYLIENKEDNTKQALFWLDKAAHQGNQEAIKLYLSNCKSTNGCFKNEFKKNMKAAGFEVSD
ncbi:tetratricopeptide repeat protein [Thalassotalea atypica]|uniref:tetratricopeptide repeat protein n=1 Tax=Thalassotalea atypica TaxID=2054316 RepID=UPI0025733AFF|nr:hypothetical protein [Thalassotalea atypica]